VIREATKDDAAAIVRIVNAAFVVEQEFRPGDRTSIAEIGALITRRQMLVCEQEGKLNGAVQVSMTDKAGYFGMLAIDPALQGSGLGRKLLAAAEEHCREAGCMEMTMSTGEERRDLVEWYQRQGYKVTSAAASDNPAFNRRIRVVQMSKPL
jgi:ribosomal protein S18 acetylase RimI-like enzyme